MVNGLATTDAARRLSAKAGSCRRDRANAIPKIAAQVTVTAGIWLRHHHPDTRFRLNMPHRDRLRRGSPVVQASRPSWHADHMNGRINFIVQLKLYCFPLSIFYSAHQIYCQSKEMMDLFYLYYFMP
jgi:hypothetical protein